MDMQDDKEPIDWLGELEEKRPSLTFLFLSHADAWQVALIIAALVLLIHNVVTAKTTLLLPATGLGYWLGFAVNDYFDAPFDAQDRRKAQRNYFVGRDGKRWPIYLGFGILSGLLLIVFGQFGRLGIWFYGLAYLAMWAYSAPPLRLKMRPGADLLMHVLFVQTFPYVLTLTLIQGTWMLPDVAIMLMLFLASLAAQLEQQARDFEVDRQNGRNFAGFVGFKVVVRALRGITAVLIITACLFVIYGVIPWFILPFGVIGLPALIHRFLRKQDAPRAEWLVLASTTTGFLYTGIIFFYYLLQ